MVQNMISTNPGLTVMAQAGYGISVNRVSNNSDEICDFIYKLFVHYQGPREN